MSVIIQIDSAMDHSPDSSDNDDNNNDNSMNVYMYFYHHRVILVNDIATAKKKFNHNNFSFKL